MLKITNNIKLGKLVGSSGGSGGSSNYEDLENKPMINGFELTGDKTGSELGLIDSASDSWQSVNGEFGCFNIFDLSGKEGGNLQIYASPNDITFATSDQPLNLLPKTYFNESPTVGAADSFENASDDTLMTKAQVIEATNGSGGGSSNYNDLTNKPSINDVELSGNKTSVDLGLLDLNTTEFQIMKGGLSVDTGLTITKDNVPSGGLAYLNGTVGLVATNNATKLELVSKEISISNNPTIQMPTTLADLPDNALLTKSQVQEMINNALNNS